MNSEAFDALLRWLIRLLAGYDMKIDAEFRKCPGKVEGVVLSPAEKGFPGVRRKRVGTKTEYVEFRVQVLLPPKFIFL